MHLSCTKRQLRPRRTKGEPMVSQQRSHHPAVTIFFDIVRRYAEDEGGATLLVTQRYMHQLWPDNNPWGHQPVPMSRVAETTGLSEKKLGELFHALVSRAALAAFAEADRQGLRPTP